MEITKIQMQQKHASRYNVFVDGEYAFSVHEDVLVKYRLRKGLEIAQDELREILTEEEKHRALYYALRFLGHRPRTAHEIIKYLTQKGFEKASCDYALDECREKGYVNDEAYAGQWIEERSRLKPRGRYLLRQELLNKGIHETVVEESIGRLLPQEEEIRLMERLLQKKYLNTVFENEYEMKKKCVPFLQRKGFPLDAALSLVESMKDRLLKQ